MFVIQIVCDRHEPDVPGVPRRCLLVVPGLVATDQQIAVVVGSKANNTKRAVFGTADLLHVLMSATRDRVDRRTSKRRPSGLQQPDTPSQRFLLFLIQREPPVVKLIRELHFPATHNHVLAITIWLCNEIDLWMTRTPASRALNASDIRGPIRTVGPDDRQRTPFTFRAVCERQPRSRRPPTRGDCHRRCVEDRSVHIRLIVSRWWICQSVSRTLDQSTESSDQVVHLLRVGRRSRSTRQPPSWESPGPRRTSACAMDRFLHCTSGDASSLPK
jgi:hypothetical protein